MPIAKARIRSTIATIMFKASALLLITCAIIPASAQEPDRAPKGPPPEGDHKARFGSHRGPGGMDGFDRLPEPERKRVRDAMDIAWKKPEMQAAKEKFMKASEEFRAALRQTLQGIDPEVVKILEKVKPSGPWEFRGPPPLKPEDPEFLKQAVARLGFELTAFGSPEKRDAMRRLHERLVETPDVKDAISKLQAAPVGERMESFKNLREVYRKAFEREVAEYRKTHPQEEAKK